MCDMSEKIGLFKAWRMKIIKLFLKKNANFLRTNWNYIKIELFIWLVDRSIKWIQPH
jgi:hypothetical protein